MNNNKAIGTKGENAANAFLLQKGYTIIERNWRHKHWEIDIIASKNNKLHFVEVKTRSNKKFGNPEDSIDNKKMNALKKGAEAYLSMNEQWMHIQFDVIAITLANKEVQEFFLIEDVYF
jgi:putative endonuclease